MDKEYSFKESLALVKNLLKQKAHPTQKHLIPGSVLMYKYNAKDKEKRYDRTPLTMVLSKSKTYMLGLNLHWCPYPMRVTLIKAFFKINKKNIKEQKPLELDYKMIKPYLKRLGYFPVIRLYIRKRMSAGAIIIPPERLLEVAKTKSETFTGGVSAEKLYSKAKKGKI